MSSTGSDIRKRALLCAGLVVALVGTASLAFVAGQVTSPEQKMAMASPPPVVQATAHIEKRVVLARQVGRAAIVFSKPKEIALPSDESGDVVTHATLKTGKTVKAGTILIEIAGHPVLAMPAPFSPYRTLTPGMTGRDVNVLRSALRSMGIKTSSYQALQSAELSALNKQLLAKGYSLPLADLEVACESKGEDAPPCTPKKVLSLPMSWWVGIKQLPATVAARGPRVGAHLSTSNAKLTLSTGQLLVEATMPSAAASIEPGMEIVFEDDLGETYTWEVKEITSRPTEDGEQSAQFTIQTAKKIPVALADASGKLTVSIGSEEPELAVPLTALVAGVVDGQPAIRIADSAGEITEVSVELGNQAEGWVAINSESELVKVGAVVVLG